MMQDDWPELDGVEDPRRGELAVFVPGSSEAWIKGTKAEVKR